jgi:hypothetical protein
VVLRICRVVSAVNLFGLPIRGLELLHGCRRTLWGGVRCVISAGD